MARKIAIPCTARADWPAQDPDFKRIMGLDPKAKWPAEGLSNPDGSTKTVYVKGDFGFVAMWVDPLRPKPPGQGRRRPNHRLMCRCPDRNCNAVMTAGRLQQHVKVHA